MTGPTQLEKIKNIAKQIASAVKEIEIFEEEIKDFAEEFNSIKKDLENALSFLAIIIGNMIVEEILTNTRN